MLAPYFRSIGITLDHKKMVLLIYVLNLIFGLMIALPFASAITSGLGNLGSVSELIKVFDFTLISDFLRNYDVGVGTLMAVAKWLIPLYVIFQLFLLGGVISIFRDSENESLGEFFRECGKWFWKYLFMFLTFLIQHLIGIVLVVIPVSVVVGDGLEGLSSEAVYWSVAKWSIGFYALIFLFISAASDFAKIALQSGELSFWKCILKGWRLVFQKFGVTWTILIINAILVLSCLLLAWNISDLLGVDSVSMIWISILLHQVINLLRVFVRIVYYGALVQAAK